MAVVTTLLTDREWQYMDPVDPHAFPEIGRVNHMVADSKGNLYFTDAANSVIYIKQKDQIRIFAGRWGGGDYAEGRRRRAVFHHPSGLAIDENDILYIADSENHVIRTIDVKNPDDTQTRVLLFMGVPHRSGNKEGTRFIYDPEHGNPPGVARFNYPGALAIHNSILYIADEFNFKIRTIRLLDAVPQTALLLGGKTNIVPTVEGAAKDVSLRRPYAIAAGSSGASTVVFFLQYGDLNMWKLQDGYVSKVLLGDPHPDSGGIAISPVDNMLYVSDVDNHKITKLNISDGTHSVVAGSGDKGIRDGPVDTAQFAELGNLTVANDGTIYVVDNHKYIRQIEVPGAVAAAQVARKRQTRRLSRRQVRRRRTSTRRSRVRR
jgi:sugar lactone lactonase YvrE